MANGVYCMRPKRITAKDVAQRAGVSPTTVSMILNGGNETKFPEETCRRVIAACKELGYVRKITIKETDTTKAIAAVVPSFSNLSYVHTLEAMQQRAKELGYTLIAFNSFREVAQEAAIAKICTQFPIAGIIVCYPFEDDTLPQLIQADKPLMLHCNKGDCRYATVLEIDGLKMGALIGEHLCALGHRRVVFVSSTFNTKQSTRIQRLEGLRSAYSAKGFDPDQCIRAYTPDTELVESSFPAEGYELGFAIAQRIIQRDEDITAFVTINDVIAVGIKDAILKAGKRVPEDYSICGCDNTDLSKYETVSLTSVDAYTRQTGRELVNIMVKKINSDASEQNSNPEGVTRVEYYPKLVVRGSTGPVNSHRLRTKRTS